MKKKYSTWYLKIVFLFWTSFSNAQTPELVKDIWSGINESYPRSLINVNGVLFFVANDPVNGVELWRSDGTSEGTALVKDIRAGSIGSAPETLTNCNGTLYFTADDGVYGRELWKSDGTQAGTMMIKDIWPGANGSYPPNITEVNGTVYFNATNLTYGTELWKTNGTEATTELVKDINPGLNSATPQNLIKFNNKLVFTAYEPTHGTELWISDGTSAGTTLVKDIYPGSQSGGLCCIINAGNLIYFQAYDGITSGYWKSDGTPAGTNFVFNNLVDLIKVGTNLYWSTYSSYVDGIYSMQVWKSDLSMTNPTLIQTIEDTRSITFYDCNGSLYFVRATNNSRNEIWKSNGTGVALFADFVHDDKIGIGYFYGSVNFLFKIDNTLFFVRSNQDFGAELWTSNGTRSGTKMVQDINPGMASSIRVAPNFPNVNGEVFFSADDGIHGIELWKIGAFVPPIENVKISNLEESINQTEYTVPREATVHHYFLVKDNITNLPLKDVILYYTVGTTKHQSLPSDSTGLIDLNITVGGNNPNLSSDDWVGLGNNTVTFHSVQNGTVSGTNAFADAPFTITVINKAPPIDKEMGVGAGFQFGDNTFNDNGNDKKKVDVGGGFKIKLGMSAGLKLGITLDSYIKIKPVSNSVWNVYFNNGLNPFVGLELGGGISIGNKALGFGGNFALGGQFDDAVRWERGFVFDLSKKFDVFKLASLMFSMNKQLPSSQELAAIFDRLASQVSSVITDLSAKTEMAYGIGVNAAGSLTGRGKIYQLNLPGYGNIPELSFNSEISGGYRFNDNNIVESIKGQGVSFANTITMSKDYNVTVQAIAALTKGNAKNIPTIKSQPFSIFPESQETGFTVKREMDFAGNLIAGSATISTKSASMQLDPNSIKTYTVDYQNSHKYGPNVAKNLFSAAYSANDNSLLQNNTIASIITGKSNSLIGNLFTDEGLARSLMRQSHDLNEFMTKTVKQYNLPQNEIELTTTQDVSLINRAGITIQIPKFKTVSFQVNLNSWKTYSHNKTQSKYVKSLDRVLLTTDYPDIFNNLEIPATNVVEDLLISIGNALESVSQAVIDYANQVITSVRHYIINQSLMLVLSNLNQPRINTAGEKLYDPKNKSVSAVNTPSVFTFTIPGTAFAQNTAIDFKYFYPSNEVSAITSADTFRIVSDVFTLTASLNEQFLTQAPNGNFTLQTDFSTYDLTFASLPINLTPVVLFLPRGGSVWQSIGAVNSTINFNQLGDYGIGVKISNDRVAPTIQVTNPGSFVSPNYIEVNLTDLQSGIDWKKTQFIANGKIMPIQRINNSNVFRINIADIPTKPSGIFIIEVQTADLAENARFYSNVYPCDEYKIVQGLELEPDNPILKKALYFIEANSKTPENKSLFFKAGQKIELKPGFETKGTSFKAEIGGCIN
ncbi:ELWxxDGT repeat protein [Runella sp.]|uniref:ELWxxDGT repeat protein n=1 Tax=Runella sp. TaxID=1960881 RepID=UPI003D09DD43